MSAIGPKRTLPVTCLHWFVALDWFVGRATGPPGTFKSCQPEFAPPYASPLIAFPVERMRLNLIK